MIRERSGNRLGRTVLAAWAGLVVAASDVHAADVPAATPAKPAIAEACKTAISQPSFGGVIGQNPNPACVTIPGVGDIYFGGAISGYGYGQSNPLPVSPPPLPSDRASRGDFSNLQAFVQKADGPVQFFVQVGVYAIPALGVVDYHSYDQTSLLFGPLPVAFGKYVYNNNWSIQGGRLPTLIGTEAPFTFQNANIQRGLLFNQENTINQGVQLNYASGPLSVSIAGTDGFFSGDLSWFTGSVTYKIDDANAVGANGGLNLGRTAVLNRSLRYQFATPLFQQNSGIINLNYNYTNGPFSLTPYIQATNVDRDVGLGILGSASTFGGAILARYAFSDNWALAGRVEYEEQTGARGSLTTPSLLYGPGSGALSFTVTPTYTIDRYFLRGEYSHVELYRATPGFAFGRSGLRTAQDRFVIETGITF